MGAIPVVMMLLMMVMMMMMLMIFFGFPLVLDHLDLLLEVWKLAPGTRLGPNTRPLEP